MPTITFRISDDEKKAVASSTKTKTSKNNKNDEKKQEEDDHEAASSASNDGITAQNKKIKQEDADEDDDVVLVSETTRGNNGTSATIISSKTHHQNNTKKRAIMRRMEELVTTMNATSARIAGNKHAAMEAIILPNPNPPSKRKRNVKEGTEKSKKPRNKKQPTSSTQDSSNKSPPADISTTTSLPHDEESFYMNCSDEELTLWLKEKYRKKAELIRKQLNLQMKEELALLRNKRSLAKLLLANNDISSSLAANQQKESKKQSTPKQTQPAPKTPRTSTPPKQSHASTPASSGSSPTSRQQMINISADDRKQSCPTCKSFCKAIFVSKSGCGHQYCEACVVVASFSSDRQDDINSNSKQMTGTPPTPSAVSLASTCTKQTCSTKGSSSISTTLSIPIPSSCPICHILESRPNKPPPIENVVAVKPKRKHPYVPEWMQSPQEHPPPRNHISSPTPATGELKKNAPTAKKVHPSSSSSYHHHHQQQQQLPTSNRTHNVDRSKQQEGDMDEVMQRNLQSEIEKGEMLQYLLALEKMRNMNPQQQGHNGNQVGQYPPSYPPYHPYNRF